MYTQKKSGFNAIACTQGVQKMDRQRKIELFDRICTQSTKGRVK